MSRRRIVLVAITAAIVITYGVLFAWRARVWHERGWTGVAYIPYSEKKEKDSVKIAPFFGYRPGGVQFSLPGSPAARAGIRTGDVIRTVNGIEPRPSQFPKLKALNEQLRRGDRVVYVLERKGARQTVPIVLESRFSSMTTVITIVSSEVSALIFLAIGFIVYWVKSQDRRALVFCSMAYLAAALYLVTGFSALDGLAHCRGITPSAMFPPAAMITNLTMLLLAMASGILTLHLALIFPAERPVLKRYPAIRRFIYFLPFIVFLWGVGLFAAADVPERSIWALLLIVSELVLLAAFSLKPLRHARTMGWKSAVFTHPFLFTFASGSLVYVLMHGTVLVSTFLPRPKIFVIAAVIFGFAVFFLSVLGLVFGYPVITCVALFRSYRDSGPEEKRQVRWPLWGTLVGVGGSAVVQLAATLMVALYPATMSHDAVAISSDLLSKVFFLIIPASFAFAILKYRLMDIDIVIKKTVVYGSLTGIIIVLYLLVVGGVGGLVVRTTGIQNQTVTIVFTLALAVALIPVRNRLQSFVDRRMFRKKHDYPQALRELSRVVSSSGTRESMLKSAIELIQQAFQSRSVVFFEGEERRRTFVARAKVGVPDELLGKLRFERGDAVLTNSDTITEPAQLELPDDERSRLRKVGAELLVPILNDRQLSAFLTLGGKLSDEAYDDEDRNFLTSVAEQLAISLDMFRLRIEEQDYRQATEIQKALLPKEIPQLEGFQIAGMYQPARVVGGDYYDVLKLSDRRVAICIGDVAGKGMPAALLMSSLQATVKAVSSDTTPPKEVCEKVRNVLAGSVSGKFLTFFYCVLDADKKTLVYTNAGHNPPILLHPDGTVKRLEEGGTAIARIFRGHGYSQGEVQLRGGDRLVMFTDGVTEARNREEEDFGEERLVQVLAASPNVSAEELQRRILESVAEFSHGNLADDVTLAIVSVE